MWGPPGRRIRRWSLATAVNSFLIIALRTILRREKSQPLYFQLLPHSLPKTTRGGYPQNSSRSSPQLWSGRSRPVGTIRPIADKRHWCHNPRRHGISSRSEETSPLSSVSKTSERTSGTCFTAFPIYPDSFGVASRPFGFQGLYLQTLSKMVALAKKAWVHRSNAKAF